MKVRVDDHAEILCSRHEHPLDPLSADELRVAVELLRAECELGDDHRIVSVTLEEPPKADVLAFDPQRPTERDAFAVTYDPVAGSGHRRRCSR